MKVLVRLKFCLLAGLLIVGVVACGDDDSSDATAPEGPPILLGSIVEVTSSVFPVPEVMEAHNAWARYLNEEQGGIAGRPVEIVNCDDHGDPARNAQCARDLIEQGVVAFIDNTALNLAQNGLPLIEAAGIPAVGGTPVSSIEYNSPFNFPTIGGGAGSYPSLAKFFAEEGAESLVFLSVNSAAGVGAAELTNQLFTTRHGGSEATGVQYNPADPDFVPALTAAVGTGADVLILGSGASTAARLLQAARIAGADSMMIGMPGAANVDSVFEAAGDAAEGVYFTTAYLPITSGDPEVLRVAEIMARYAPDLDFGEKVQNSVAGLELLRVLIERTVEGGAELTPETLLETLRGVESEQLIMGPEWSPANAPEGMSQVWNSAAIIVQRVGDELIPVSDFVSGL